MMTRIQDWLSLSSLPSNDDDNNSIPTNRFFPISPFLNNVGCVLLTIAYVKVALETACWILVNVGKRQEPRTLVHLTVSSCIVFWPLYDASHWSWRLNAIVPLALALRMVYKVRMNESVVKDNYQTTKLQSRMVCVCVCLFCISLSLSL